MSLPPTAPFYRRLRQSLSPLLLFTLISLVALTLSRACLDIWQAERFSSFYDLLRVFGFGVRIDLSLVCYWLAIPTLIHLLLPARASASRYWQFALRAWLVFGFSVAVFMEVATPAFIQEYDLRPNRLFVEYLVYPREVFSMLWQGHRPALLIGLLSAVVVPVVCWRLASRLPAPPLPGLRLWERLLVLVLLYPLLFLGARGTLQHRPINPSYTAFSSDPLINSLTLDSAYSVLYAVRAMRNEVDAAALYPHLDDQAVIDEIRASMGVPPDRFTSTALPTLHKQHPAPAGLPRYRNLVIILEESLGARFVGTLGGLPLTPELDRLADQGWLFDRLYATGTRSVRGIEAVLTGFVPTPARSVVKLPRAQRDFFTLPALLKREGYDTSFIYGGEGHFDNMSGFFLGNGIDRVIDQNDYPSPRFVGSWGVSDEDLFDRADAEFTRLHASGKPFFSLVFSSSNHDPFEYPAGVIEPYEQPAATRPNAIRYADHALGGFFDRARRAPYWDDTLFLVVADHDARVFGADLVPIVNYRIPGLLLGKGLPPRRDHRLVSQIDLPPTLLALLGVDAEQPMTGHDMTSEAPDYQGRALMQYDRNQAYLEGNRVVILQPEKPPLQYRYDFVSHQLTPTEPDPTLVRRALAQPLWGSMAYRRGLYRLDASTVATQGDPDTTLATRR